MSTSKGPRSSRASEPRPATSASVDRGGPSPERDGPGWTLLTSHGRVLLLIARFPDIRLRDIADRARITERSAASIVRDLEHAGYITKRRVGRRNTYLVHDDQTFRHPAEAEHPVRELIEIFTRY